MEVGGARVTATERGRRRPWRHGGATPAYAGHLRPVERRGRVATASVSQRGAFEVGTPNPNGSGEPAHVRGARRR